MSQEIVFEDTADSAYLAKFTADEVGADIETHGHVAVTSENMTQDPFTTKGSLANALDESIEDFSNPNNDPTDESSGEVEGITQDPQRKDEEKPEEGNLPDDTTMDKAPVEIVEKKAKDSLAAALDEAIAMDAVTETPGEADDEAHHKWEMGEIEKGVPQIPKSLGGEEKTDENGLVYLEYTFTVDPAKYMSNNYMPVNPASADKEAQQMPRSAAYDMFKSAYERQGGGNVQTEDDITTESIELTKEEKKTEPNAKEETEAAAEADKEEKQAADEGVEAVVLDYATFIDGSSFMCYDEQGGIDYTKIVMDAGAKKPVTRETCKTTFAQCRAKNPLFCRFHGPKLLEKDIRTAIAAMVKGCVVSVTKDKGQKNPLTFRLTIGCPPSMKKNVDRIVHQFMSNNPGISSPEEYKDLSDGKRTTEFDMDILRADEPPKRNDVKGQSSIIETKKAEAKGKTMPVVGDTPASIEKQVNPSAVEEVAEKPEEAQEEVKEEVVEEAPSEEEPKGDETSGLEELKERLAAEVDGIANDINQKFFPDGRSKGNAFGKLIKGMRDAAAAMPNEVLEQAYDDALEAAKDYEWTLRDFAEAKEGPIEDDRDPNKPGGKRVTDPKYIKDILESTAKEVGVKAKALEEAIAKFQKTLDGAKEQDNAAGEETAEEAATEASSNEGMEIPDGSENPAEGQNGGNGEVIAEAEGKPPRKIQGDVIDEAAKMLAKRSGYAVPAIKKDIETRMSGKKPVTKPVIDFLRDSLPKDNPILGEMEKLYEQGGVSEGVQKAEEAAKKVVKDGGASSAAKEAARKVGKAAKKARASRKVEAELTEKKDVSRNEASKGGLGNTIVSAAIDKAIDTANKEAEAAEDEVANANEEMTKAIEEDFRETERRAKGEAAASVEKSLMEMAKVVFPEDSESNTASQEADKIVDDLKSYAKSKGIDNYDIGNMGEIVDGIKNASIAIEDLMDDFKKSMEATGIGFHSEDIEFTASQIGDIANEVAEGFNILREMAAEDKAFIDKGAQLKKEIGEIVGEVNGGDEKGGSKIRPSEKEFTAAAAAIANAGDDVFDDAFAGLAALVDGKVQGLGSMSAEEVAKEMAGRYKGILEKDGDKHKGMIAAIEAAMGKVGGGEVKAKKQPKSIFSETTFERYGEEPNMDPKTAELVPGGTGDVYGASLLRYAAEKGGLLRMPKGYREYRKAKAQWNDAMAHNKKFNGSFANSLNKPKMSDFGVVDPMADWIDNVLDGGVKNNNALYKALFGFTPQIGANDNAFDDAPDEIRLAAQKNGIESVCNDFLEARGKYAKWAQGIAEARAKREELGLSEGDVFSMASMETNPNGDAEYNEAYEAVQGYEADRPEIQNFSEASLSGKKRGDAIRFSSDGPSYDFVGYDAESGTLTVAPEGTIDNPLLDEDEIASSATTYRISRDGIEEVKPTKEVTNGHEDEGGVDKDGDGDGEVAGGGEASTQGGGGRDKAEIVRKGSGKPSSEAMGRIGEIYKDWVEEDVPGWVNSLTKEEADEYATMLANARDHGLEVGSTAIRDLDEYEKGMSSLIGRGEKPKVGEAKGDKVVEASPAKSEEAKKPKAEPAKSAKPVDAGKTTVMEASKRLGMDAYRPEKEMKMLRAQALQRAKDSPRMAQRVKDIDTILADREAKKSLNDNGGGKFAGIVEDEMPKEIRDGLVAEALVMALEG